MIIKKGISTVLMLSLLLTVLIGFPAFADEDKSAGEEQVRQKEIAKAFGWTEDAFGNKSKAAADDVEALLSIGVLPKGAGDIALDEPIDAVELNGALRSLYAFIGGSPDIEIPFVENIYFKDGDKTVHSVKHIAALNALAGVVKRARLDLLNDPGEYRADDARDNAYGKTLNKYADFYTIDPEDRANIVFLDENGVIVPGGKNDDKLMPESSVSRGKMFMTIANVVWATNRDAMLEYAKRVKAPVILNSKGEEFYGRDVFLYWSEVDKAEAYLVRILDKSGKLLAETRTDEAYLNLVDDEIQTSEGAVTGVADPPETSEGAVTDAVESPETSEGAVTDAVESPETSEGAVTEVAESPETSEGAVTDVVEPSETSEGAVAGVVEDAQDDADVQADNSTLSFTDVFGEANKTVEAVFEVQSIDRHEAVSKPSKSVRFKALKYDSARARYGRKAIHYKDGEAGKKHQTVVKVPVWKYVGDQKVASTARFKIHVKLADDVEQIFREIFIGEDQFPIKSVGGFSIREKRSEHNYGTAIDINPVENYMHGGKDQQVGKFWDPEASAFSIPQDGDVVRAFERHGWYWAGNGWGKKYDYMHFSYMGT